VVGHLLLASPHAGFDDELLVALVHGDHGAVLRLHDLATDDVLVQGVRAVEGSLGGRVEAAHLEHAILLFAFLALLFGNLLSDGLLNELLLAAKHGQLVSRVLASAIV
jgi:hypothetical protein